MNETFLFTGDVYRNNDQKKRHIEFQKLFRYQFLRCGILISCIHCCKSGRKERRSTLAKKDNLILIGMPASGKSTVGVILAKVIGYDFIDSDLLIQKKEGMRLADIIKKKGIDGFLEVENEVNASIEASQCVIATGGSAVYGEEAMKHLCEIGAVIYLQVDYSVIQKRLHNIRQRGVVLRQGQTLQDLYDERTVLYEKYADLIVREGSGEIEAVVARIIRTLRAGAKK